MASEIKKAEDWLRFVRKYGPVARNGNMFDEDILRTARRSGIRPIAFAHPLAATLSTYFVGDSAKPRSVILTGAAGDGKTHLCRQVWERVGGSPDEWESDNPHLAVTFLDPNGRECRLNVLRDLSAWVPQAGLPWPKEKEDLLLRFSGLLRAGDQGEYFIIAGNDGQLIETWRRLPELPDVCFTRDLFERLLVEGRAEEPGVSLSFFNLSAYKSSRLLRLALDAFLSHEGWTDCFAERASGIAICGEDSPVRHNYDLLRSPLVQERLSALVELCDLSGLHIPIRELLLLLANALLGHPACPDGVMRPSDILRVMADGSACQASIYGNIFGANLSQTRRDSIPVFRYLNLFRIGHETTNRIDNLLIFGNTDENLKALFDQFMASDPFYGATKTFLASQQQYIEGSEQEDETTADFLQGLITQRRALFFKIPQEQKDDLRLWELTVFKYAGEYRDRVVEGLRKIGKIERVIIARLVRGLNRIWVGMLVDSDRELYLATGLSFSNARVSRVLEERVSVAPRLGQKIDVVASASGVPVLQVALSHECVCEFPLTLVRYEFLSRVADGALPMSFSKECYEDVMSFKCRTLGAFVRSRKADGEAGADDLVFRLLDVDEHGNPREETVEALDV